MKGQMSGMDEPASHRSARERELTRRRGIDPVTGGSVRRWRCEGLPLSCSCLRVFACSILRSRLPAPKPMRPAFRSACVFTASSPTLTAATPPYLSATPQRRVARRNVSSTPTPIHTSRAPASSIAPRGTGGIDTIRSQIAPADSPAPANGIVGASARLRLLRGAYRRSHGKLDVIVRDPEHYLLGCFVVHLLGQDTGFLGSPTPMFWIFQMRDIGHGRALSSHHTP